MGSNYVSNADLEAYIKDKELTIRYNELKQCTEINGMSYSSDELDAFARGIAKDLGITIDLAHAIVNTVADSYNPMRDYFNSLPDVDTRDTANRFLDCFDIPDAEQKHWFIRWLVGIVARAYGSTDLTGLLILKYDTEPVITLTKYLSIFEEWYTDSKILSKYGTRQLMASNLIWLCNDYHSKEYDDASNFIGEYVKATYLELSKQNEIEGVRHNPIVSFLSATHNPAKVYAPYNYWARQIDVQSISDDYLTIDINTLYAELKSVARNANTCDRLHIFGVKPLKRYGRRLDLYRLGVQVL